MLKSLAVSIYYGVILIITGLFGTVSITPNIPSNVKAGENFLVSITIDKGNLDGFARFTLELPNGFTATPKESFGGTFTFEEQKVKINWYNLPYDERMVITFNVHVPPTISGSFDLNGDFKYLDDNDIAIKKLPAHTITVEGSETVEDLTAKTTYNYQGVRIKEIDCIRQKPYFNDKDEIIVNLLIVNKANINQFAKIQEQIPRGYKAVSVKSKNAIFTSTGRFIKYMWMNIPEKEYLVVTYKLIQTEKIPNQPFIIKGEFSYFRNKRTDVISIAERNIDLTKFSEEKLVVDNSPEPEKKKHKIDLLDAGDEYTGTEVTLASDVYIPPEKTNDSASNYYSTNNNTNNYSRFTGDISGLSISYRIQIAAGHKIVRKNYFKKFHIKDNVQIEIHQGWHKYTVGSFHLYKKARDYRNKIWAQTSINDAFVCAYTNGQRITVQEAIMVANQKWYK